MFGAKKLKARIAELENQKRAYRDSLLEMSKEKSEVVDENTALRRELNNALDFIKNDGYGVQMADGEDIRYSFYGKNKRAAELEGKLKAREGLIDNLNHLREKECKEMDTLREEIDVLKSENARLDSTLFKINHERALRSARSNKRKQ